MVKICQDDLYQLYVNPIFTFRGEDFKTFQPLIDDKSMVIEIGCFVIIVRRTKWLQDVDVYHITTMKLAVFPRYWGDVNKVDCEVILSEVQH
jgi:hypothetical protein